MHCGKCGEEIEKGASLCASCGAALVQSANETVVAKTYALAVASVLLGVVGAGWRWLALPGLIAGCVALVRIRRSGGRLHGKGEAIAGICVSLFTLAILPPLWSHERAVLRKTTCLSNMRSVGLSLLMYADDNNNRFPPADNWADAIMPFRRNKEVFMCPAIWQRRYYYAYNRALALGRREAIPDPARTVILFESDADWNAAGGVGDLPGLPRHLGGENFAFADGHAGWRSRDNRFDLLWQP